MKMIERKLLGENKNNTRIKGGSKLIEDIKSIRKIVDNLETSFETTNGLHVQQRMNMSSMKMRNGRLAEGLKEAEKLNETMLNLFRPNVTIEAFPESLKKNVQRSWHQKYDALLKLNEQLRRQIHAKDIVIKEKNCEINMLQQKLIETGKKVVDRDESLRTICNKFLNLKKRKDENEILLRGSIEDLRGSLQQNIFPKNPTKMTKMSLIPDNEALLAQELRRSQRLVRENRFLKSIIDDSRRKNFDDPNEISGHSSDSYMTSLARID